MIPNVSHVVHYLYGFAAAILISVVLGGIAVSFVQKAMTVRRVSRNGSRLVRKACFTLVVLIGAALYWFVATPQ